GDQPHPGAGYGGREQRLEPGQTVTRPDEKRPPGRVPLDTHRQVRWYRDREGEQGLHVQEVASDPEVPAARAFVLGFARRSGRSWRISGSSDPALRPGPFRPDSELRPRPVRSTPEVSVVVPVFEEEESL